jgi:beta-phosphoglucomutase family hydrolase
MALTINWARFGAVLFDLDGVVTPTAEIHKRAWAALFAAWDFTDDDYLAYVDGRPRYDGVATFLASRGVTLPHGDSTDAPGDDTVCALGNRKDDMFMEALERDGIAPYPGTMSVVAELERAGVAMAIVSSSRNARPVLDASELTSRFPVIIDGVVAADEELAGKPDPAMFLAAASHLGVEPGRCVVVEDATSGAAAGAAGEFALVVGIDRGGNRTALLDAGADLVVDDLDETVAALGVSA